MFIFVLLLATAFDFFAMVANANNTECDDSAPSAKPNYVCHTK